MCDHNSAVYDCAGCIMIGNNSSNVVRMSGHPDPRSLDVSGLTNLRVLTAASDPGINLANLSNLDGYSCMIIDLNHLQSNVIFQLDQGIRLTTEQIIKLYQDSLKPTKPTTTNWDDMIGIKK